MSNKAPLTVSQVNELVRMTLDASKLFSAITVVGEISNLKVHFASGHIYFSLKDEEAVLKCVMFRASAMKMNFQPENGMKVVARGRISVFPRDGQYQLYADAMEPDGLGGRYLAFEQLKTKLQSEGLFDEARKRPIPTMPSTIGVITSASGAAFQDILNVLKRRYPLGRVLLYPASVQGSEAVGTLIDGVRWFSSHSKEADVLIIGRGGGSFEDLMAFNDEQLARVIAACPIPVVSAVGHETDFTICDFVSDRRAPTPSAAAEIVAPDVTVLSQTIDSLSMRISTAILTKCERLQDRLRYCGEHRMLSSPMEYVNEKERLLLQTQDRLGEIYTKTVEQKMNALTQVRARLDALSPLSVLNRGYTAVFDAHGRVVSGVKGIEKDDVLSLRFADGRATAQIVSIDKGGNE
ncbi:MAG: exodeoxyribonuclease VII large subunit [Ruminococcaceae bacterium]|nr:exodeoxyribonuclease VII large subunit [Oscillospiraceae bacterium]